MGGSGSTRWRLHSRKWCVEECLTLPIGLFSRDGILRENVKRSGTIQWPEDRLGISCEILFAIDTVSTKPGVLRIRYQHAHSRQIVDQQITLTTTPLPWGGLKRWFLCPRCQASSSPNPRRRKLYLPPGATHFGCRHCHDLTYVSSQEAHRFDAMYKSLAASVGGDWKDIRDILSGRIV